MASPRTLVLFDLDGTLVDGQHSIYATFAAIFPRFGYTPPTRAMSAPSSAVPCRRRSATCSARIAPVMPMTEAYKQHFHAMRSDDGYTEALYDDVDEVVRRLRRATTSCSAQRPARRCVAIRWLIDRNGWHGFFATLQGADTAASKPSPEMVLNACRETGMDPADVIVFGDSIYDMQMAASAGASAVGVSWGYGDPDDLLMAGASRIIHRFRDVEQAIADWKVGARKA